jgi:hypothetical protein
MLHAERLGFIHPDRLEQVEFSAPLPADMERAVQILRQFPAPP